MCELLPAFWAVAEHLFLSKLLDEVMLHLQETIRFLHISLSAGHHCSLSILKEHFSDLKTENWNSMA